MVDLYNLMKISIDNTPRKLEFFENSPQPPFLNSPTNVLVTRLVGLVGQILSYQKCFGVGIEGVKFGIYKEFVM